MKVTAVSALLLLTTSAALADGTTDFNRDIRPIFAKHCTKCHGGVKAAGDVSFVYRDKALTVIKPGHPADSELIRRVRSTDPDEVMPKPEQGPPLTAGELALLERWIQEGAAWSEPWSFVRPVDRPRPTIARTTWPQMPLDDHVLTRLEAAGLTPSEPALPAEWYRRVSLDLTGLPPTSEQWEAFAQHWQSDPTAARRRAVDGLLDSPHYGERWASMWLDLARYSDTFGYEKDPHRDIWPWRDWVIRALNADMPFDEFTIKQLAGDLLEDPQPDDLLATAFHRNTQCNTEGGTDDEEFRLLAAIDRVNTTWTVWQATTFGCVRCHAHPYDPFAQGDYYRFLAIFNNTEDCDQNDDFPRTRVIRDRAQQATATQLEQQVRATRLTLHRTGVELARPITDWQPLRPRELKSSGGTLTARDDGRIVASGTLPIGVTYTLTFPAEPLTALRLSLFPDSEDPTRWPERGAILSKVEVTLIDAEGRRHPVAIREIIADALSGPFDPQDSLTDSDGGFGDYPVLRGPHWAVLVLDQPLAPATGATFAGAKLEILMRQKAASNSGFQACTLRNFSWQRSTDSRWSQLAADVQRQKLWEQWRADRERWNQTGGTLVPVMRERDPTARRETRVFTRGNLLVKGAVVTPGLPELFAVAPPAANRPFNRLDLARWLVGKDNTLTARVLANRLWAELFGRGIVETLEDFGTSGSPPTHPELLDHLAVRLATDHAWSLKSFLREVVLSATYGQTSRATATQRERDPTNLWYARGPRVRLTAEMVRDQALVVSGLLVPRLYGPPVFPPQPPGVWSTVYSGAEWKTSTGDDRYRRAIYTYCKRTSGYPEMLTFDAPTRDVCAARRIPTNTPLQALVTLNDPAFFEMAQALATRMDQAGPSLQDKITSGYRRIVLSPPGPETVQALTALYDETLTECRSQVAQSKNLAATPELAALVLVANTLLNMDVALTR